MIRKARRLLGTSALGLFVSLWLFGCSGQQQADEEVEASEQGEQSAEGEGQGDAQGENQGNNLAAGEGNAAAEGDAGGGEAAAGAEAATGTENDLQEIIQEMNGQPAPNGAQNVPLAQNQAPAVPVPTEAPAAPVASGPAPQGSAPIPFQPGGAPAGQGLPELGSKMAYIVEKGDTLGKISQKIFGSPGRWKELADLSGITNPSRIFPGDLVYYTLEEGAVAFAQVYEATSRSEEQVKPGDTLATIAKRVYGTTTAWRSIWRQNDKIDNPDIVPPGTTVYYLPQGAAVAAAQKIQPKSVNNNSKTHKSHKKIATKTQNGTHKPVITDTNNIQIEVLTESTQPTQTFQANSQLEASNKNQTNSAAVSESFFESNQQLI